MPPQDLFARATGLVETYVLPFGLRLLGAITLWVIARFVARTVRGLVRKNLEGRLLDATLVRYVDSMLSVLFTLVILLGVLSLFGVETTSVAGLLAAAGVAIGMAWSGLLSNFAGGVFLMILKPFRVNEMICVAGVTGDVREIGLFVTTIDTADNVRTYVGNSKIFSDTIQNFSTNPFRRVDLKAQLDHSVNPADAVQRIRERLKSVPNIVENPQPAVEILEFNASGPLLAVRPFCHNNHYWDVYFGTNVAIQQALSAAGYPVPAPVIIHKSA
jgi:small conductance mechanosensitive channel